MSDRGTYTNAQPDGEGLTLEKLLKARADIETMLPRLLYHTVDYMPVLTNEGEPLVLLVAPGKMDAHARELWMGPDFEDYILTHPDNMPQIKQFYAGRFRLEPLIVAKKEADSGATIPDERA